MPKYELSSLARRDLREIARYTLLTWGLNQALHYDQSLEECMTQLAGKPQLGRLCPAIYPGSRRYEHEKHVIFYCEEQGGIRVLRILHQRQLPRRHVMEDN